MSNNYLKNILDKNSLTNLIVEPRIKSRFEASNVQSLEDESTNNFELDKPSVQKSQLIVKGPLEEEKKRFKTINFEKTNVNNSHEHQTKLLNTPENHFSSESDEHRDNSEERVQLMLSKSKDVENEWKTSNPNSENNIENKTYGLLNKPIKTITNKANRLDGNYHAVAKKDGITTEGQPSIKISIGRVEVKAGKAAQKRPTNPKTRPDLKLSLEDFINKRK